MREGRRSTALLVLALLAVAVVGGLVWARTATADRTAASGAIARSGQSGSADEASPGVPLQTLAQGESRTAGIETTTLIAAGNPTEAHHIVALLGSSLDVARIGEVDFGTSLLVAVVRGQVPTGGYGIAIDGIAAAQDEVRVTVSLADPAPGRILPEVLSYPYHLVVVPRTALPTQPGVRWVAVTPGGDLLAETQLP